MKTNYSLEQQVMDIVWTDGLLNKFSKEKKALLVAFSFFLGRCNAIENLMNGDFVFFFSQTSEMAEDPRNVGFALSLTEYLEEQWKKSGYTKLLNHKGKGNLAQSEADIKSLDEFVIYSIENGLEDITDENVLLSVFSFFLGRIFVASDMVNGYLMEVLCSDDSNIRSYDYAMNMLYSLTEHWQTITA